MANFDDVFAGKTGKEPDFQDKPFDKDTWVAEKKQLRERLYETMDTTATAMPHDATLFQTFLDVSAQFDRYSAGNVLLVTAQMPAATQLKDFDAWKKDGAYVKKGETGIYILSPGKEYTREDDGSTGTYFDPKKVFDISQTNAKRTHTPAPDQRALLTALIEYAPCAFATSEALPDGVNTQYSVEDKVMTVRAGMDAPDIFRAVAQELAAVYMDRDGLSSVDWRFTAHCAAYAVCKRHNIPMKFRGDAIPEKMRTLDGQEMRRELDMIHSIAGDMISDMEKAFEGQQRQAKKRDDGAR